MLRSRISWEAPRPGRFTIDDWEIDLPKTALVVVDMQRGYTNPEMGVGPGLEKDFPDIHRYYYSAIGERVLPGIKRLLAFARSCGLEAIYTRTGLQLPEGRDVAPWSWRAFQAHSSVSNLFPKDSPDYQVVPDIAPLPHELMVDKNTTSPFPSTALDQLLRNMGV
ncbi:MAG: cysteine hydrolase, partial [Dehalococcoidia bacterium]|nr:cysteine hydrolase [Dehalococcoidia bacterium]